MQLDIGLQRPTEVVTRAYNAMLGIVHRVLFNLSLPPHADPSKYLSAYVDGSVHYRNPILPIYGKKPVITMNTDIATITLDGQSWIVTLGNSDEFDGLGTDVVVNRIL